MFSCMVFLSEKGSERFGEDMVSEFQYSNQSVSNFNCVCVCACACVCVFEC